MNADYNAVVMVIAALRSMPVQDDRPLTSVEQQIFDAQLRQIVKAECGKTDLPHC